MTLSHKKYTVHQTQKKVALYPLASNWHKKDWVILDPKPLNK